MVKKIFYFMAVMCFFVSAGYSAALTKDVIIHLVDQTVVDIKADAPGTIQKIINGENPYKSKDIPELYVFVYNSDVEIVAHYKKHLVGRSYKGLPDVRGKKFRDEIVDGALKHNSGWVDYFYKKPGESGLHEKTTYYKLVLGNDGKQYIVCAGMYK